MVTVITPARLSSSSTIIGLVSMAQSPTAIIPLCASPLPSFVFHHLILCHHISRSSCLPPAPWMKVDADAFTPDGRLDCPTASSTLLSSSSSDTAPASPSTLTLSSLLGLLVEPPPTSALPSASDAADARRERSVWPGRVHCPIASGGGGQALAWTLSPTAASLPPLLPPVTAASLLHMAAGEPASAVTPSAFPAIDRAFTLLARRLRRPFQPYHPTLESALLLPHGLQQPPPPLLPAHAATAAEEALVSGRRHWPPRASASAAHTRALPADAVALPPEQTGEVQARGGSSADAAAEGPDSVERLRRTRRMMVEQAEGWRLQRLVTTTRQHRASAPSSAPWARCAHPCFCL